MSACQHAKPLGKDGWQDSNGNPSEAPVVDVQCSCGFEGDVTELLECKEEKECDETLWCPQCKTSGWEYT
jgi:hypothetical protein